LAKARCQRRSFPVYAALVARGERKTPIALPRRRRAPSRLIVAVLFVAGVFATPVLIAAIALDSRRQARADHPASFGSCFPGAG